MYNVLLVDDEPMIRKGLSKIIETSGMEITSLRTAENGAEAIELIRAEQPHFLFTDIRMSKMDGLELCRLVSSEFPHIQIVLVTGYDDFDYARQGISYGVKDYILKPITKKNILQVLDKLIEAERKSVHALPSLTKSSEWITVMEEAIWTLQEGGIAHAIQSLLDELSTKGMSLQQQAGLVEELSKLLVQRLNERDVYKIDLTFDKEGIHQAEQLHSRLTDFAAAATEALRAKRRGKVKDPIEEAKKYIETHLSRDFSLEEVAATLGLNASYFSQLFKQMTGETFAQYRIRRRMDLAKQLLAVPHHKITDISYEVGYADHPHFTKTFKKATGLTPKEYREKLGIE